MDFPPLSARPRLPRGQSPLVVSTSVQRGASLLEAARARAGALRRPVIVSFAEPAPPNDPLDTMEALARAADADPVLAAHAAGGRAYWARPDEGFALGGLGAVTTFTAAGAGRFAEIDRAWATLRADALFDDPSGGARCVGPVLLGGFAFEPDGSARGWWENFPPALLALPRVQLAVADGKCWLTTTLCVAPDGTPDVDPAALAELGARVRSAVRTAPRPPAGSRIASLAFTDVPAAADWRALVGRAVAAIRAGGMEKVVLARAVHAAAEGRLDAAAALRHLRAAHPECAVFGFWQGDRAFVGASPERLVRLDRNVVRTSSLAGSAPRGGAPDEDAALAAGLLASGKDRAEHELVRRALVDALGELCEQVTAPNGPSVLTLRNVHHLHTPVQARLRAGRSLLDLVGRLHPSPAVGGSPREAALRFIREHEELDRGWYAAPVGWLDGQGGEFAVALRSAVIAGRTACLFAGCGVVAESRPDAEYDETLLKLRPMQAALAAALADGSATADGVAMANNTTTTATP